MSRRVSLPGADELFRTTGGRALQPSQPRQHANAEVPGQQGAAERPLRPVPAPDGEPGPGSGPPSDAGPDDDAGEPAARTEHSGREAGPDTQPARGTGAVPEGPRRPLGGLPGPAAQQAAAAVAQPRRKASRPNRRPSGRERHDEKITVYVSAEELMDLEHARLVLRGEHGLAVDRGRIVREAVAVVLADLESRGDASILVRRLRGR